MTVLTMSLWPGGLLWWMGWGVPLMRCANIHLWYNNKHNVTYIQCTSELNEHYTIYVHCTVLQWRLHMVNMWYAGPAAVFSIFSSVLCVELYHPLCPCQSMEEWWSAKKCKTTVKECYHQLQKSAIICTTKMCKTIQKRAACTPREEWWCKNCIHWQVQWTC